MSPLLKGRKHQIRIILSIFKPKIKFLFITLCSTTKVWGWIKDCRDNSDEQNCPAGKSKLIMPSSKMILTTFNIFYYTTAKGQLKFKMSFGWHRFDQKTTKFF